MCTWEAELRYRGLSDGVLSPTLQQSLCPLRPSEDVLKEAHRKLIEKYQPTAQRFSEGDFTEEERAFLRQPNL